MKEKIKDLYHKYHGKELVIILAVYAFQISIYFFYAWLQPKTHTIHMKVDDYIPFLPIFVIPYYFYYLNWWLSVWVTSFHSSETFKRMTKVVLSCVIFSGIFYAFYPVRMIRPEITGNGFFENLVKNFVYKLDVNSVNCLPSLHAVMGTTCALAAIKNKDGNIFGRIWFIFAGVTMAIATVFIKQHYLIDLIAGAALVFIFDGIYALQEKIAYKKLCKKLDSSLVN